jgi:hypothetical protein
VNAMGRRRLDAAVIRALQPGPLDDDQLGEKLGTSRQSARSAALRMQDAGIVTRVRPAGGKWITCLMGDRPAPEAARQDQPPGGLPPMTLDLPTAANALEAVYAFTGGRPPRARVSLLEQAVTGADSQHVAELLQREMVTDSLLVAGLIVKSLTGEINVLIHALGILLTLPHILVPGETVLSVSLGAGTGGRPYDLETTYRVAEFKFTRWRGHDAVRQRELFADFVNLAEDDSDRWRVLYVTGSLPERFLKNSRRRLASVCERRPEIMRRITSLYGDRYRTVRDYTSDRGHRVEIVDLEPILPAYATADLA